MKKSKLVALATLSFIVSQSAYSLDPIEIREKIPQIPSNVDIPDSLIPVPLEEPDVKIFQAGNHFFKRALTSTKPRTTNSEKFVTLPGAKTTVLVPKGRDVLVNVAYTAESRCNEINSTSPNWCEVRILVDGVEASPMASTFQTDTYAFDSTDRGTETSASWESHAMDRHACVFNSKGKANKL